MANPVPERDVALLFDMLLAAPDLKPFATGMSDVTFAENRLHQNAVIRSPEIIGESAGKLAPRTR